MNIAVRLIFSRHGADPRAPAWKQTMRQALCLTRTRIGLVLVGVVVLVAIVGPWVSPHSPTAFVGMPFGGPSHKAMFGTDVLGRDVFSRFLWGGGSVIGLALLATLLGVLSGAAVGLVAAYWRGSVDAVMMRVNDGLLAFPQILVVLLLVTGFGTNLWLLVLAVGGTHAPRTVRVIRGAAQGIIGSDFIKASEAIGESRWRILIGEMLPNVTGPLLVEFGLRMIFSIGIVTGASFLGFGLQPPDPNWGLMINENRVGVAQQPWGVVLPVGAIALLAVGINLVTDGIARATAGVSRKVDV